MRLVGVVCVVGGWMLAVAGLFITPTNVGRCVIALLGIAVTLYGMLGILNRYYVERAIWKK